MTLPTTFYFNIGTSELPFTSWVMAGIQDIRNQLKESPDKSIKITGHTCDLPVSKPETIAKYGDNVKLGRARAQTVLSLLRGSFHELPEDRFVVSSLADLKPEDINDKTKNRRTTVELV